MKHKLHYLFASSYLKHLNCARIETRRRTIFFFLLTLALLYTLVELQQVNRWTINKYFPSNHNVALIIAHPDDEAIFFSPTILQLKNENRIRLHVICVTNGNFYGLGAVRSKELFRSCHEFGLEKEQVYLLNDDMFYDHPSIRWRNTSALAQKLREVLAGFKVDTVLSFGPYGCSGHPNHRDVHLTVRTLTDYRRFFITDVCFIRYYGGIFEVIYAYLTNPAKNAFFLSWDILTTYNAMKSHLSQFRFHWILVRYVLVNDWWVYNKNEEVGIELPTF